MYVNCRMTFSVKAYYVSILKKQHLRCYCEKLHRSLGVDFDGTKAIRVFDQKELDPRVFALRDKFIYCDYIQQHQSLFSYKRRITALKAYFTVKEKRQVEKQRSALSVLLKSKEESKISEKNDNENYNGDKQQSRRTISLPYSTSDNVSTQEWDDTDTQELEDDEDDSNQITGTTLEEKYMETYKNTFQKHKHIIEEYGASFKDYATSPSPYFPSNWMTDYEHYTDTSMHDNVDDIYGTPKPDIPVSNTPCAGCGIALHCKDPAIPGYLPSEIFLKLNQRDLVSTICQRCHFLKTYSIALDAKVCPEEYSKMLQVLKEKKCTILLIIDAADIPGSIWPGLADILHQKSRVIIAVNKIDLLPVDSPHFFKNVAESIITSVCKVTGLADKQIAGVQLISALTGFGIERLINCLIKSTPTKNDVYLIGCTNAGKSSLFNTLVHSDYCDAEAASVMQNVTTSPWPGTTLNLLKFPIQHFSDGFAAARFTRVAHHGKIPHDVMSSKRQLYEEQKNITIATLEEPVGRTLRPKSTEIESKKDIFAEKFVIRDKRKRPSGSSSEAWCYDTPGTLNPDQILDLLTIDELTSVVSKRILAPRSFALHPQSTVFLAGLGRLDYVNGNNITRCTLFASHMLPITICRTSDADEIYEKLLETEAFVVPMNDPERLKMWPELKSKTFNVVGVGMQESVADVILSSAGWIALTLHQGNAAEYRAWTPQGRGLHLRTPALLRKSILLRGQRVSGTPIYAKGRQAYFSKLVTN